MSAVLSAILVALKVIAAIVDRLDDASKAKAHKALLDAARMDVEDDIADIARAAYRKRMHPEPDVVPNPHKHYRD